MNPITGVYNQKVSCEQFLEVWSELEKMLVQNKNNIDKISQQQNYTESTSIPNDEYERSDIYDSNKKNDSTKLNLQKG